MVIYDLGKYRYYLKWRKVVNKSPIIGLNKLTLNNIEYTITTDNNKLL